MLPLQKLEKNYKNNIFKTVESMESWGSNKVKMKFLKVP